MTPATARRTNLDALEDEELVPLAQRGNRRAVDLLFRRHRSGLAGFVRSKFGVDPARAEEIVQETAVKAFEHLHRFDPDQSSWRTWVYAIGSNFAKNELRDYGVRRDDLNLTDVADDVEDARPVHERPHLRDPEARADALQRRRYLREIIQRAAEQLRPHQRIVFVLREFENLKYEEVAEEVGIGTGTVKSRLNRARTAFRENLAELDPDVAEAYDAGRIKRPR